MRKPTSISLKGNPLSRLVGSRTDNESEFAWEFERALS